MPRKNTKTSRSLDAARLAEEKAKPTPKAPRAKKTQPVEPEPAPKRGPGRPRLEDTGLVPDDVGASTPPLPPSPTDDMGKPLSALWDAVRANYSPTVVTQVDALLTTGRLSLDDLIWLELAELAQIRVWLSRPKVGDRTRERGLSMSLQTRKNLAKLLEIRGAIGSANDVPVRVPEGLQLDSLPDPDDGDDVLGEPTDDELPERYR